ncbi:MAG: mRNA surveillance protein pelota [Candidatus Helarchaeota archaeon]
MKIVEKDFKKGEITLIIENMNDLWHLYNIIQPGDLIFARTLRRTRRDEDSLRADKGERIPVFLGIEVEEYNFHPFTNRLRIKGTIIEGPEDLVSLHSHHTLNVEVNTKLTIRKKTWESFVLKRIEMAETSSTQPEILILTLDKGEAYFARATEIGYKKIAEITANIPGKRFKVDYYDKSVEDFFKSLLQVLNENLSEGNIDAVIIAGPGFTKEHFLKFLKEKEPKLLSKIQLIDTSNTGKSGVIEVIRKGDTIKSIENMRLTKETELIQEFLKRLGKNQRNIAYGMDEVENAKNYGAIETLMITDTLLRIADMEKRKKLDMLLKEIEKIGGKIVVISSLHSAGEQLESFGSIAALLRFELR